MKLAGWLWSQKNRRNYSGTLQAILFMMKKIVIRLKFFNEALHTHATNHNIHQRLKLRLKDMCLFRNALKRTCTVIRHPQVVQGETDYLTNCCCSRSLFKMNETIYILMATRITKCFYVDSTDVYTCAKHANATGCYIYVM